MRWLECLCVQFGQFFSSKKFMQTIPFASHAPEDKALEFMQQCYAPYTWGKQPTYGHTKLNLHIYWRPPRTLREQLGWLTTGTRQWPDWTWIGWHATLASITRPSQEGQKPSWAAILPEWEPQQYGLCIQPQCSWPSNCNFFSFAGCIA